MIRIEKAEAATTLVLDRPDKRNALDWDMIRQLAGALAEADADPGCRCVLVTGAGESFCAGRDLGVGKGRGKGGGGGRGELEQVLADDDAYQAVFEALRRLAKPSVAVVRGHAVAGGFTLAMACDFVLAERGTRFGALEMRGGFPAAINTAILGHLVGPRQALELLLSAETFPAERLHAMGLVNRLAEDAEDLAEVERAFVAGLVALDPVAVRLTKETLRATVAMPLGEALIVGKQLNALLMASGRIDRAAEFFAASRRQGAPGAGDGA